MNGLTFEEWFEKEYGDKPDTENDSYAQVAKAAWEASRDNIRYWDL